MMRSHHSIADGVSVMCAHLALGDTYDTSCLLTIKKVPAWQKVLLIVSIPFYIPQILYTILTNKVKKNPLHDGVRNLSGVKKAASGETIPIKDVKECASRLGITINDLAMACLSVTFK